MVHGDAGRFELSTPPFEQRWVILQPRIGTSCLGYCFLQHAPGSGYVLLHHVMGETLGARGVWAYVAGGMGGLSESLARAARDAGAESYCDAPVARIGAANGISPQAEGLEAAFLPNAGDIAAAVKGLI